MKNKFIFVATFILSMVMVMTAFAAKSEWVSDEAGWKYYDKEGCAVACAWQKSGDNWYYLGPDEYMLKSALIESDTGSFYYVDETGVRVANKWVLITDANYDLTDIWMYFKADGKSVTSGWYTVNNVKYFFSDNKMLTGFIDDNGAVDSYADAVYMCDANGAKLTGWQNVTDDDGNSLWIYLKSGKKVFDCILTINNKKYAFDDSGKMLTGEVATASVKYNFDSTGAMVKKAWVAKTDDSGEDYWIYCTANGTLVEDGQYKVNGRYFYFVDFKMSTGWNDNKYYKADGAMVTGKYVMSNDFGEDVTYVFSKDGTPAVDGTNGYAYTTDAKGHGGVLVIPADDHKYVEFNGKLVNKGGKYCAKGTYKDSNYGYEWTVDENGMATRIK